MIDHVRKIVESNNNLAPGAQDPPKLSYRVCWTWQKVKHEPGPDNVKTCVGELQRAQIALFKGQVGEATAITRISDIRWVEIDPHNVPLWVGRSHKSSHRARSATGVENTRAGPFREMAQITF
jgi:hypothetical protein